jgi:hypothetical protein
VVAAKLPQHPVSSVLHHVHVEQQRRPRHPVLLVAEAQSREAQCCAGCDSLLGVRRPPDILVCECRTARRSPCTPSSSGRGRTRSAYKPNVNHKC